MSQNDKIVRHIINENLKSALRQKGHEPSETIPDDLVLLQSGLDSLAFAILITELEDTLGYDPFTLQEEPIYPRTFGEFLSVYLQFSEHLSPNVTA